jgi:5-methylcytosine-specific restriction protein A
MAWSRESRHARGYGSAWDKLRRVVIARDMGLCQPCLAKGRVTPGTEVDHVRPRAKGGTDDPDNLQCICGPCHVEKTAADEGRRVKPTIGPDGWPVA